MPDTTLSTRHRCRPLCCAPGAKTPDRRGAGESAQPVRDGESAAMSAYEHRALRAMQRLACACAGVLLVALVSPATSDPIPERYSEEDFTRVEKIDTHVHLYG